MNPAEKLRAALQSLLDAHGDHWQLAEQVRASPVILFGQIWHKSGR